MNASIVKPNEFPSSVILYGGTGQSLVMRPIIEYFGSQLAAVIDDTPDLRPPFDDVPLLTGISGLACWLDGRKLNDIGFFVTIGNPHGRVRLRLHNELVMRGLRPCTCIHPTAFVEKDVILGDGTQILAGAGRLATDGEP